MDKVLFFWFFAYLYISSTCPFSLEKTNQPKTTKQIIFFSVILRGAHLEDV